MTSFPEILIRRKENTSYKHRGGACFGALSSCCSLVNASALACLGVGVDKVQEGGSTVPVPGLPLPGPFANRCHVVIIMMILTMSATMAGMYCLLCARSGIGVFHL